MVNNKKFFDHVGGGSICAPDKQILRRAARLESLAVPMKNNGYGQYLL